MRKGKGLSVGLCKFSEATCKDTKDVKTVSMLYTALCGLVLYHGDMPLVQFIKKDFCSANL